MYAKKINRLHASTPLWKESPEIRVLWFTILMFRDERGYICATPDELQKLSELPKDLFGDAYQFLIGASENNDTEYIKKTDKGLRINCFDRSERNRIDLLPKWKEKSREGFAEYIEETKRGYEEIAKDYVFLLELKEFYPYANIGQSLQKAFSTYWGTERAWLRRRRKTANTINWKETISNTLKFSLVKMKGEDYERDYFERMIKNKSKAVNNVNY